LTSFERFICERENLVFDSLIYFVFIWFVQHHSNIILFTFSWLFICHILSILLVILQALLLSGGYSAKPLDLFPVVFSTTFSVCTLNIRSLLNPLKYIAIYDLAQSLNIHLVALTETWITPTATSAELFNAIIPGFTLISCPSRPASTTLTKVHIVGGGAAFLIRKPATLLSTSFILVWHFFYCSLLDQIVFTKPFFLCQD